MRVNITTNIVVTLVLSPEEAAWLHHLMEHPILDDTMFHEDPEDTAMRLKFLEATAPQP